MSYEDDAAKLYKALYQLKDSDEREKEIINIIKNSTLQSRFMIRKFYDQVYTKKSLIDDLEKELSGNFGKITRYLFLDPLEYDCLEIFNALDSLFYDKKNIFEIITARNFDYLQLLIKKYQKMYGKELTDILYDKFGNEIGKAIVAILKTKPNEGNIDNVNNFDFELENDTKEKMEKLENKADYLIKTSPKEWIKDIVNFKEIFVKTTPQELITIGRIFYEKSKKDLPSVIVKEMSSDAGKFLTEVVYNKCHPSELFAIKLYDAIKGIGTDNNSLIRVMVTRHELDMNIIRVLYKYIYEVELSEDIIGDTSGNYQTLLLELIKKKN